MVSIDRRRLVWQQPLNPRAGEVVCYSEADITNAIVAANRDRKPLVMRLAAPIVITRTIVIPENIPSAVLTGSGAPSQVSTAAAFAATSCISSRCTGPVMIESIGVTSSSSGVYAFDFSPDATADHASVVGCTMDTPGFIKGENGNLTSLNISGCRMDQSATLAAAVDVDAAMLVDGCSASMLSGGAFGVTGARSRVIGSIFSGGGVTVAGSRSIVTGNSFGGEDGLIVSGSRCAISANVFGPTVGDGLVVTGGDNTIQGNTGPNTTPLTTTGGSGGNFLGVNKGFSKTLHAGDTDLGP